MTPLPSVSMERTILSQSSSSTYAPVAARSASLSCGMGVVGAVKLCGTVTEGVARRERGDP